MNEYTAEDFAQARFAEHPDGHLATRSKRIEGAWSNYYTDERMAKGGWRPVREAVPLSLDALREAWDAAEIITADNLPRKGDEVIEGKIGRSFRVFVSGGKWTAPGSPAYRILRRGPRRPEGAEELEEVLSDFAIHATQAARNIRSGLRTLLAERGVRVEAPNDPR